MIGIYKVKKVTCLMLYFASPSLSLVRFGQLLCYALQYNESVH